MRLSIVLSLIPILMHAEPASYLKDLEEFGYCVVPNVISTEETEVLYERLWHEFVEKAWPKCKLEDRSNWKETFPKQNKMGIFAGPAGQTQVMWDVRQDPRIIELFANVWNTHDLIVSMDGMSLMCPPEIREGEYEPWPHVDQAVLRRADGTAHSNNPPMGFVSESLLKTAPYTIQGQFLFEDSLEGDGGFYCIPKSHLRFEEFAPKLETIHATYTGLEKRDRRTALFNEFFDEGTDADGKPYKKQHVTAKRGSFILWDSRTIHWNQHAEKTRPSSDKPKVRMVGFMCYVPKSRLTEEGKKLRAEAFALGIATGHNPTPPELKPTKDHIWKGYEEYLEDSSYVHPTIHLTPLGKSILGVE